jgi:heme/copper-type cytochrome/quinol oxidase subunit 2
MRVTRASDTDHRTSRPRASAPRGYAPRTVFGALAPLVAALAMCASGTAAANTSNGYNLPVGVTSLSEAMYGLHMEVFWICVGIAVVVFGTMIYCLVKFRHSQGAVPDTTMVHSTKVEIIWTIIPVLILVVMAIPAADLILKQEDTRNSELSIRVTGYQWKWQYQYMDAARASISSRPEAGLELRAPSCTPASIPSSVPNYLLGRRSSPGHSQRHQGAAAADLHGCHPRLVGAGFRRQALGHPGFRQRIVVQGRCRQGRHLPRPMRRAVRPRPWLHARRRGRAHPRRLQEMGRGTEGGEKQAAAQALPRRRGALAHNGAVPLTAQVQN